jgi:PadR family transcriptional regulator, regulatory protein AphA
MNVRSLCLSILYDGEATGYEIRRLCVEGECSYFVEASFGSIYPALAKLEADGLVTSRVEHQEGKPSKKVYAITETGRHEFRQSLFEPLGEEVFRSPFLLFARFAHILPADLVESRLKEQLDRVEADIEKLKEAETEHADHAPDAWVIRYGLSCLEVARTHLRDHMSELVALAQPEAVRKDAAE